MWAYYSSSCGVSLQDEIKTPIKQFFTALQEDRKGLFMSDIIRSFFFIAIAAGAIWLYLKNKLKAGIAIAIIGVFAFIDVMAIDVKYMNSDDFVTKDDYDNLFVPTAADNQIMQDKSSYRVLDLRQGLNEAFNGGALTSYFHKSIGGYNPAKLSIYQDLIDSQLYRFPNCLPVINMLNTKYVITQEGQAQQNPMALGNVWFVKNVQFVNTAQDVMKGLDKFNPKDTAITEKSFSNVLKSVTSFDSAASIQMVSNHNDTIVYKSKSAAEQIAVFSEVYYSEGWNVYVDGKKSEYAKVNYVLRGMMVPAGEHTIEFRFEPESHALGWKITSASAWIIMLLFIPAVFFEVRKKKQAA
ncbi:MAG: YfhO family protein [Panacibacter sp.]